MTIFLLAFGVIALIVGTFIIYNTFSMIVAQRLRELALLRAIGADRKQVRRSVLLEAGIIGAIGSVLGLAGGVGLAYGLHAVLDALKLGLPSGGLILSVRTVIVAVLLGTGVTLLSAYAPARRAAKIPPVAAMREEFASPAAATLRRRTALGPSSRSPVAWRRSPARSRPRAGAVRPSSAWDCWVWRPASCCWHRCWLDG